MVQFPAFHNLTPEHLLVDVPTISQDDTNIAHSFKDKSAFVGHDLRVICLKIVQIETNLVIRPGFDASSNGLNSFHGLAVI